MMPLKCCTPYTRKFGKLSSGHRTARSQFSFQSQRRAMPKKAQTTAQNCTHFICSLWPHGLYSPWNSPGQNTGVDSLSLLQGIFPTQGSNPGPPHCRKFIYQLRDRGSPRMLEWVTYPFSSGSSWPRNWMGVSCIAGRFFTNWAIREAPFHMLVK